MRSKNVIEVFNEGLSPQEAEVVKGGLNSSSGCVGSSIYVCVIFGKMDQIHAYTEHPIKGKVKIVTISYAVNSRIIFLLIIVYEIVPIIKF